MSKKIRMKFIKTKDMIYRDSYRGYLGVQK